MLRNTTRIIITLLACLVTAPTNAFEALDDNQLANVTAGSASVDNSSQKLLARIPLRHHDSKSRVDGEILVLPAQTTSTMTGNLQLMDHAQSNLRSLININAVNSPVQVLLNLNISIDSRIKNLHQWNALTTH